MNKHEWIGLAIILGVMAFVFVVFAGFNSLTCKTRWDGTFDTSYGPIAGCRLKINGAWIPEQNYRAN